MGHGETLNLTVLLALKKAKWVRFSLDAATPETHRMTHQSVGILREHLMQ